MNIRQFIIDLLKGLEAEIPPPTYCHHVLTYAQYGSETAGWTDKLALQVNINGKFYCFFIEDSDLVGDINQIIGQIIQDVRSSDTIQTMQLGVSVGSYKNGTDRI